VIAREPTRALLLGALLCLCAAPREARAQRLHIEPEDQLWGPLVFGVAGALTLGAATAEIFYRPDAPWVGRYGGEGRSSHLLEDRPQTRRRLALAGRLLCSAVTLQAQYVDPALAVVSGDRHVHVYPEHTSRGTRS